MTRSKPKTRKRLGKVSDFNNIVASF